MHYVADCCVVTLISGFKTIKVVELKVLKPGPSSRLEVALPRNSVRVSIALESLVCPCVALSDSPHVY